jgi:hypothetical protein
VLSDARPRPGAVRLVEQRGVGGFVLVEQESNREPARVILANLGELLIGGDPFASLEVEEVRWGSSPCSAEITDLSALARSRESLLRLMREVCAVL